MGRAHTVPSDHIFSFRDHVLKGQVDVHPILEELCEDSERYRQLANLAPHVRPATRHEDLVQPDRLQAFDHLVMEGTVIRLLGDRLPGTEPRNRCGCGTPPPRPPRTGGSAVADVPASFRLERALDVRASVSATL